jgi:urease accessory protein
MISIKLYNKGARPMNSDFRAVTGKKSATILPVYGPGLRSGDLRFWIPLMVMFFAIFHPSAVLAHQETGSIIGIVSGLKHPVSGMDHVLAMIAVGLWGAQLGAPAIWVLPVAFPMVMAFGGMLGLMGLPLPGIEVGIAVSALALGSMVLTESRPPLWVAAVLVAFFAVFHGHAHGTELPVGSSGLLYSIGFVMATGTLHGVGITMGLVHRWSRGRFAIRAAGAMVAISGVFFLVRIFV